MYLTILKIAQPFLQRFLVKRAAEYVADYLNKRREPRPELEEDSALSFEPELAECPPSWRGYSSSDAFWFILSGILLGSTLGIILSYLSRPAEN